MEDREALKPIYIKALRLNIEISDFPSDNLLKIYQIDSVKAMEILTTIEASLNCELDLTKFNPNFLDSLDTLFAFIQNCIEVPRTYS